MITQILKTRQAQNMVWFQYLQTHLARFLARDTTMELQRRIYVGVEVFDDCLQQF